ncbi:hypothetical protein BJX76DRAFT_324488 [Aspergillus varians]
MLSLYKSSSHAISLSIFYSGPVGGRRGLGDMALGGWPGWARVVLRLFLLGPILRLALPVSFRPFSFLLGQLNLLYASSSVSLALLDGRAGLGDTFAIFDFLSTPTFLFHSHIFSVYATYSAIISASFDIFGH